VGVLEGFLSTWSKARETFGEGVPQTGERFDQSGPLRQMQTTVEAAAPGSRWSGTAASAYGTANTEHGKVFGQLAGLDQRLAAQVTQSANIVSTGRQNLDAVRQWVVDAAASVPPGKNRETQLMPIVQKGLGQLQEVVTTSNGQLNTVAGEVKKIGGEYQALENQRFGGSKGGSKEGMQGIVGIKDGPLFDQAPTTETGQTGPGLSLPPGDPFIGNTNFGQWHTVSTSPTGPWPPLSTGFHAYPEDTPLKVGPTTGMYVPGQTWISDEDAPIVQYKEGYRFRIAGVEDTPYTRVVYENGQYQVQQWQSNVYEYQRNTSTVPGGDFGGLPPIQNIDHTWERITLPEIATLSANNPTTTYYLPNGCGGTVDFNGGVVENYDLPEPPIIVRPR